jgi:hypothetical protein
MESLAALTIATMPALSALGNFDHALTKADRSGSVGAGVSQGGLAAFSEVKSLKYAPLFALPKCGMFIFPEDLNRGSNPLGVTFTSLFARVVRRFRSFTL